MLHLDINMFCRNVSVCVVREEHWVERKEVDEETEGRMNSWSWNRWWGERGRGRGRSQWGQLSQKRWKKGLKTWSRGGGGAAAAEGVDEEEKWITPMVKGEQICDESTGSSLITWRPLTPLRRSHCWVSISSSQLQTGWWTVFNTLIPTETKTGDHINPLKSNSIQELHRAAEGLWLRRQNWQQNIPSSLTYKGLQCWWLILPYIHLFTYS